MNETAVQKPAHSSGWIRARPHTTFVIRALQAHQGEKRSRVCVQSPLARTGNALILSSVHAH